MKIVNLAGGHEINFYREEQCILDERTKKLVLKEGETPFASFPCEGCVRANRSASTVSTVQINGITVNQNKVSYGEPIGLPETLENETLYIVSFIAHCAIRQHMGEDYASHFAIIDGMVTGADGKPCGCTALSVG